eukprot:s46_g29.t1
MPGQALSALAVATDILAHSDLSVEAQNWKQCRVNLMLQHGLHNVLPPLFGGTCCDMAMAMWCLEIIQLHG